MVWPWRPRRKKKQQLLAQLERHRLFSHCLWELSAIKPSTPDQRNVTACPCKKHENDLSLVCIISPEACLPCNNAAQWVTRKKHKSSVRTSWKQLIAVSAISMVDGISSENVSTTTALWTIWLEVNSPVCCHPAVTNGQIWTHLPFSHTKPSQHKRMDQQAGASHEPGLKAFS